LGTSQLFVGEINVRSKLLILALAAGAIFAVRADAHHSFAATYIVDKEIKVDGKLVEFMYRNPHSFVKVEAPDDTGEMQTWTVEWGGGAQLSRDGVSRDSLKAGDRVLISGNPAGNGWAWFNSRVR
jgi:hypothetical protein